MDAASTNNQKILINAANFLTQSFPGRKLRADSLAGMNAHEIGHILYTDFEIDEIYIKSLQTGMKYPSEPAPLEFEDETNMLEIKDAYRENNTAAIRIISKIGASVLNILEDVYIEARICEAFSGVLRSGILLNNLRFPELTPSVSTQIANGDYPLSIIINLLIQYCKCGDINNLHNYAGEYMDALYGCVPYIDNSVYDDDMRARCTAANHIIIRLWPFIKKLAEQANENKNEPENDNDSNGEQSDDDGGGNDTNSDEDENGEAGSGNPDDEGNENPSDENAEENGSNAGSQGEENNSPEEYGDASGRQGEGSDSPGENDPGAESDSSIENIINELNRQILKSGDDPVGDTHPVSADKLDYNPQSVEDERNKIQQVVEDETERIKLEDTDEISDGGRGGVSHDRSYAGAGYASAENDMNRILSQMAEEKAVISIENELSDELQAEADKISLSHSHQGVHITVHRMSVVPPELIQSYLNVSPPLLRLSKHMQKQISQILKDRQEGGKMPGLLMGKRLDSKALAGEDGRIFYNYKLPGDKIQLTVGLLIDESGSMGGRDRITMARAAAIVIQDFCEKLSIPCMIYGHTALFDVDMYAYAEFDSIDKKDKYRLMDIASRLNNHDGAALRFVAERLLKRSEKTKLLILISDGQPSAVGYGGTAAEADLRGIKKEYERKGVTLFAAAIGDDKPNIERIYGNGFLDITDLNKLPMNLTRLISAHLR